MPASIYWQNIVHIRFFKTIMDRTGVKQQLCSSLLLVRWRWSTRLSVSTTTTSHLTTRQLHAHTHCAMCLTAKKSQSLLKSVDFSLFHCIGQHTTTVCIPASLPSAQFNKLLLRCLLSSQPIPVILHTKCSFNLKTLGHFLTLWTWRHSYSYLNDPTHGHYFRIEWGHLSHWCQN